MKLAAFFALLGFISGFILVVLFPQLSVNTVSFIEQENRSLGYIPDYYSVKVGSVVAAATAQLPYLLSFAGFIVGLFLHLILKRLSERHKITI